VKSQSGKGRGTRVDRDKISGPTVPRTTDPSMVVGVPAKSADDEVRSKMVELPFHIANRAHRQKAEPLM